MCTHRTVPEFSSECLNGVSILILREYHTWAARAWALNVQVGLARLGNGQGLIKHKGKNNNNKKNMVRQNCLSFLQAARKPAK